MVRRPRQRLVRGTGLADRRQLCHLDRCEPDRDVPGGHLRSAPHRRRASPGPADRIQHRSGVSPRSAVGYRPGRFQPPALPSSSASRRVTTSSRSSSCSTRAGTPGPKRAVSGAPIAGVHNSGWVQSPGAQRLQDPAYTRVLQSYVTGVVGMFRNDPRVLGWDVWNEPDNPCARLPQGRTRGQAGTGRRVPPARVPVDARRQSGTTADQRRLAGALERPRTAAARSAACNSSTPTSSASTATATRPNSRPASTNSLLWDDRSSAPSTWRGIWAAPWKESCRSPSGATSAPTTGASSPGERRRICRGIRGSGPTPRLQIRGSAICCTRTVGPMTTTRSASSESSPEWRAPADAVEPPLAHRTRPRSSARLSQDLRRARPYKFDCMADHRASSA